MCRGDKEVSNELLKYLLNKLLLREKVNFIYLMKTNKSLVVGTDRITWISRPPKDCEKGDIDFD